MRDASVWRLTLRTALPRLSRGHVRIALLLLSVLAGLSVADFSVFAQTPADVLTLDRAIDIAVAFNRPMKMSRIEEQRAVDDIAALRTRRWPAFDLRTMSGGFLTPLQFSFSQGAFGTFPATGPIPFADVSIDSPRQLSTAVLFTAVQPITQLRKISQGETLLKLGAAVAAVQTDKRRQELIADVRRVYYGLHQAGAGLVATREALTQLEELDRVVTGYVESGVALPRDRLSVRTERAKAMSELLRLGHLQATLSERLNLLLGRDLATPFVVTELPAAAMDDRDLDGAVARAKAAHPSVREADLNVQRAAQDLRLKAMDRMPDVGVSFTYIRLLNVAVLPQTVAAASLVLSWEPFDWGRRRDETSARGRTLEQARIGSQEAQAIVELNVRAKFRAVLEAQEALAVAQLARQTAAEEVRVMTDRYRAEAALLKDVLAAQTATAMAMLAHQQALGTFWTARAELDQAVGELP